ncbi:MAG: ABC transporter ATP-binding protein [Solirubrobacterales bacterium]
MTEQQSTGTDHRAADRLLLDAGVRGGGWLVVLVLAALLLAGAAIALPALIGAAVNAIVDGGALGHWLIWVGLLVAVLVVCDALDDLGAGAVTARSTAWLRRVTLEHVLALGTRVTERFSPGELTTRLVGNAADAGGVAVSVVRAGGNLIPALGATVALAIIDPWLCLTFLAGTAVLLVLVRAFAKDASELAGRYLAVQGSIVSRLTDAISGARTIAAAGTEARERDRVLAPLPDLRRYGLDTWRIQMRIIVQNGLVVGLLEIAVIAVAGFELAHHRISAGELVAASQYVLLGTTLGGTAVGAINRLARSRAAAARIAEVLSEPAPRTGTDSLPAGGGRLEYRDVSLRIGDSVALDGIDLTIPAGALVGVVGPSGAGKSLLARLAGRLVDPDQGEVVLDGVPLSDLDPGELRREVGFGFERPTLIGETVAEAIAFGSRTPSSPEIVAAAKSAEADGFIRRMPTGYGTPLADAPMSGGEAQRVGLARTFAHAGRVVVLDDVASSLDTVTEHQISEVLTGALGDRTRIVVAHRASTAARMDFVVWLDQGRIRAKAPHHQLWQDPEYRALFEPEERGQGPLEAVTESRGTR